MERRPRVPAPAFILQHPNPVGCDAEDGLVELSLQIVGFVFPCDDLLHQLVRVAHFLVAENAQEGGEAALGEQHFPEAQVAVPGHGAGEEHVEFHEEQVGEVDVFLRPVVCVSDQAIAAFIGGYVHEEPDFLDGEGRGGGEHQALLLETGDDPVDDAFAEEDHPEPFETGDVPDLEVGFGLVGAQGGIAEAELTVAPEGENVRRSGGSDPGMGQYHGGETAVGETVEVAADGVEGEKMVNIQVADHFKHEFRVVEEAIENPVVVVGGD